MALRGQDVHAAQGHHALALVGLQKGVDGGELAGGCDSVNRLPQGMHGQEVHRLLDLGIEGAGDLLLRRPGQPADRVQVGPERGALRGQREQGLDGRVVGGKGGEDSEIAPGQRFLVLRGRLVLGQGLRVLGRHLPHGLVGGRLSLRG